VDSEAAKVAVSNDIAAGRGFKIRGTPTYVIANKTYSGRIPKKVISAALTPNQN
jgi:protein-disulfide isomerase